MKIPAIPGPRDVTTALTTLAPRLGSLLSGAEALLARAGVLLEEIELVVARVEATRRDADDVVARADAVVARIDETNTRADAAIGRVDETAARADTLVLLLEPRVRALLPLLGRLEVTVTPARVAAAGPLLDLLPQITAAVRRLEPVLDGLQTVSPDLRDLLEASHELNEMLAHLPGMGRVRRKVEEEQLEEQAGD